ncbi:hypothetical protein [[Bacillus] enclensis]|uniref:hypothetical protein n=1 Tax=[Bacillus] enclensis TaxID=1402860 RepID=UPI0018DC4CD8|nr:hypothetical protein [[Bacillus] enclensis]MBH9965583.1 hypothetical protein [[Bacillus] enclensis]
MSDKKRVHFRAAFYNTEQGSGVGIERYEPGKPVKITYIASVYFDEGLSSREAVKFIMSHVEKLIGEDEEAMIRLQRRYNLPNWNKVLIRKVENPVRLTEAYNLANDALQRKSTITEEI